MYWWPYMKGRGINKIRMKIFFSICNSSLLHNKMPLSSDGNFGLSNKHMQSTFLFPSPLQLLSQNFSFWRWASGAV